MKTSHLFFLFLGFTFVLLVAFSFIYTRLNSVATFPENSITLIVEPGSFAKTARKLETFKIISDPLLFKIYARLTGKANRIKTGEYEFEAGINQLEVLNRLVEGKSKSYIVTIQEGLNMYEIADTLEAHGLVKRDEFLQVCRDKEFVKELLEEDVSSLEGYLFPNTYHFSKLMGSQQIAREMVNQFLESYAEVTQAPTKVKMKRHPAVTLASIVEKETGVPEERGLVSSVFHNRMKLGMMLQTDPTVLYGMLDELGSKPNNIKRSDLASPNRYNTYTFRGLPYGPISNPGKAALAATLNPEPSEFLYFVSKNDGTHVFSVNYKDHNAAVQKFQLDRKQRAGKSWRDYSDKKAK